jgi:hypothetical protein
LLLQAVLRMAARIGAHGRADDAACRRAYSGSAAAADRCAETCAQRRAKKRFADGLVVRRVRAAGDAGAGEIPASRIILQKRIGLFVRARHYRNRRAHRRRHAAAQKRSGQRDGSH